MSGGSLDYFYFRFEDPLEKISKERNKMGKKQVVSKGAFRIPKCLKIFENCAGLFS